MSDIEVNKPARLNSGGRRMSVTSIKNSIATCVWHDSDGKERSAEYHVDMLVRSYTLEELGKMIG